MIIFYDSSKSKNYTRKCAALLMKKNNLLISGQKKINHQENYSVKINFK